MKQEQEQMAMVTKQRKAEAKAEARAMSEQMKADRRAKGAVDKQTKASERQQQRQTQMQAKQARREEQKEERAKFKQMQDSKRLAKRAAKQPTKVWLMRTGALTFEIVDENGGRIRANSGSDGEQYTPAIKRQKLDKDYSEGGTDGAAGSSAADGAADEHTEDYSEDYRLTDYRLTAMVAWLDKLMLDEIAELFNERVTDEIAPGYSELVAVPICLGDIRQRLMSGVYTQMDYPNLAEAMKHDFVLMFKNCKAYNEEGSPITDTAKKLLGRCKTLCKSEARRQQRM
jgi:hypothetical protein